MRRTKSYTQAGMTREHNPYTLIDGQFVRCGKCNSLAKKDKGAVYICMSNPKHRTTVRREFRSMKRPLKGTQSETRKDTNGKANGGSQS